MREFLSWAYEMSQDLYTDLKEHMDSRVDNWPMMGSPLYPITVVCLYLTFVVYLGPKIMRRYPPFEIKGILLVYNTSALTFNFLMGLALTWLIYKANYSLLCQRVRFKAGDTEDAIAAWVWMFHVAKVIELSDTTFIIVKHKSDQISLLHVYHHSTIVIASWIGTRFVPGGSTAVIAAINCWIHVLMYTYYKISVRGLEHWFPYKKFVTTMQMVQFVLTIIICIRALTAVEECNFPVWISAWLVVYMFTFLILFSDFYNATYLTGRRKSNGRRDSKAEKKDAGQGKKID